MLTLARGCRRSDKCTISDSMLDVNGLWPFSGRPVRLRHTSLPRDALTPAMSGRCTDRSDLFLKQMRRLSDYCVV